MKKLVLVGALACAFAVALSASSADAGPFGRRGGGLYGGGYNSGGYYGGYGYAGYGGYSPYYTYGNWGGSYPYSVYGSGYYTPYASANYGWPSAYTGMSSYSPYYSYANTGYGINSYVTPASWDTNNAQYSQNARDLNTRQSFYSPNQGGNDATIRVEVPDPRARVYFDDTPTQQQGTDRVFSTPPLDPNKTYTYTIRATWTDNGHEMNRSKDVKVQAGRMAMVDFRNRGDTNENIANPREDRRDLSNPGTTDKDNPRPGIDRSTPPPQ